VWLPDEEEGFGDGNDGGLEEVEVVGKKIGKKKEKKKCSGGVREWWRKKRKENNNNNNKVMIKTKSKNQNYVPNTIFFFKL
jgi:hypothetical protein